MPKALILLSGGLDSLVSLDMARKKADIELALTIDYGQRALEEEISAAKQIADYYNINHEVLELHFLKSLSKNALTSFNEGDLKKLSDVWVPNRNGLFLNVAASFCDKLKYDYVIFGANKEEGEDFPDNTEDFCNAINKSLEFSTLNKTKVLAPCLQLDKVQIINYAVDNKLPLGLIKSCYDSNANTKKRHCGKCMSCLLLKNALIKAGHKELIEELF